MGEKRGMQALESWCRQMTAGYDGVKVSNMTSSWKDGLAFCALIHHFRPDLINFSSLSAKNVYENNQLAFQVAEQHLGIPALLDAEDMVNCSSPDRLSILTYLSQFYQVFAGSPKAIGVSALKRPVTTVASPPGGGSTTGGTPTKDATLEIRGQPFKAEIFARQLQDSDGSRPVAAVRRPPDLCVSCHNAVFLAERLLVNGRLHHRVCFRCARCKSQLSMANYYETENDQYCCETCPDEVKTESSTSSNIPEIQAQVINIEEKVMIDNSVAISDSKKVQLPKHFLDSMMNSGSAEVNQEEVTLKSDSQDVVDIATIPSPEEESSSEEEEEEEEESSVDIEEEEENVQPTRPEESVVPPEEDAQKEIVTPAEPEAQRALVEVLPPVVEEECETFLSEKVAEVSVKEEETKPTATAPCEPPLPPPDVDPVVVPSERLEEELKPSEPPLPPPDVDPVVVAQSEEKEEEPKPSEPDVDVVVVVPVPRQRKGKKSGDTSRPTSTPKEVEYPDELNPFDDDTPPEPEAPKRVLLEAPKISLNPFGSDDEDEDEDEDDPNPPKASKIPPGRPPPPTVLRSPSSASSSVNVTPSPKKRAAPAPPPPKPQRSPSISSSSGGESAQPAPSTLRRKTAPPPPPPVSDGSSPVPAPRTSLPPPSSSSSPRPKPRLLSAVSPNLPELDRPSDKEHKDLSNWQMQNSTNKDSHGQWKRKKGPAPPRPSPQKRKLRKMPLKVIQLELEDIEVKQVELERQGVQLEESIRSLTEPEDGSEPSLTSGVHVEEMILQLFDLVNEKNELLRRQTELMYIRRQQRLEEEHAELEWQIRCLMEKPGGEKTDEDRLREEELINRLVEVVHRRAEIVDCLEMDRRRQEEEDHSIQQHLDVFNSRGAAGGGGTEEPTPPKTKSKGLKMIKSPINLMKKDKTKKQKKKDKSSNVKDDDVDKDVDEAEISSTASTSKPPNVKETKDKKSKWFKS